MSVTKMSFTKLSPTMQPFRARYCFNAAVAAFACAAALTAGNVAAQQPQPGTQTRPAQKQATPAQPKAPVNSAKSAARSSDSALRQRIEQLEEQLADMQVMVGTLELLAKGAATPRHRVAAQVAVPTPAASKVWNCKCVNCRNKSSSSQAKSAPWAAGPPQCHATRASRVSARHAAQVPLQSRGQARRALAGLVRRQ